MENSKENLDPQTDESELSEEELDETSGGIIIIGGKTGANRFANPSTRFADLNPQPLPPGPPVDLNKKLGSH